MDNMNFFHDSLFLCNISSLFFDSLLNARRAFFLFEIVHLIFGHHHGTYLHGILSEVLGMLSFVAVIIAFIKVSRATFTLSKE